MPAAPRKYTMTELAKLVGCSRPTLHAWANDGCPVDGDPMSVLRWRARNIQPRHGGIDGAETPWTNLADAVLAAERAARALHAAVDLAWQTIDLQIPAADLDDATLHVDGLLGEVFPDIARRLPGVRRSPAAQDKLLRRLLALPVFDSREPTE